MHVNPHGCLPPLPAHPPAPAPINPRSTHLPDDGCRGRPLGLAQLPVPCQDWRQRGHPHQAAKRQRHAECHQLDEVRGRGGWGGALAATPTCCKELLCRQPQCSKQQQQATAAAAAAAAASSKQRCSRTPTRGPLLAIPATTPAAACTAVRPMSTTPPLPQETTAAAVAAADLRRGAACWRARLCRSRGGHRLLSTAAGSLQELAAAMIID